MSRRPRCENGQCMICSAPQYKLYEPTLSSQLKHFRYSQTFGEEVNVLAGRPQRLEGGLSCRN